MTIDEKDAIIRYLEFHLLSFIGRHERDIPATVVYSIYADIYDIMNDMELSLQSIIEIQESLQRP